MKKLITVLVLVGIALSVGLGVAHGERYVNLDIRNLIVTNSLKAKSLELGGDPRTGNAGTAITASGAELNAVDGIPVTFTVALAASATTDGLEATITAKDAAGNTVAAILPVEVWISEAATGAGLTADSYSGAVTAATGSILMAVTAKKHFLALTANTGILKLLAVDSANPADQYIAVAKPLRNGVVVSGASGTNWEGAGS